MEDRIKAIMDDEIIYGVVSESKKTNKTNFRKIELRPFNKKGDLKYQFSCKQDKQVIHLNYDREELPSRLLDLLNDSFNQCIIYTKNADYHLTKYSKLKIKKSDPSKKAETLTEHNIQKEYIFQENGAYDFLIKLGIMDKNGNILHSKYNKFRQLNKYIELVESSIECFENKKDLTIIDFGCGKSYLTFALYYYLKVILKKQVNIIGLDLKEDVIDFCNSIAKDLNYDSLSFQKGDIKDFNSNKNIDMVITLHACDTATDEAIIQSLKWNTQVILTVPCCQHELFNQIKNPSMDIMLKHGILKERLSAMITDTIRGKLLEACGYQVTICEFISLEHTAKNVLIKAIKTSKPNKKAYLKYLEFSELWNVKPYLEKAILENKFINLN